MSGALRGFGFRFYEGRVRYWYCDADGVMRWSDNDEPVPDPTPARQSGAGD